MNIKTFSDLSLCKRLSEFGKINTVDEQTAWIIIRIQSGN